MKLGLVGCGHIGGSLALALKRAGAATAVVGFDRDRAVAERARELGVIDSIWEEIGTPAGAEVVVVAVPPRAIVEVCAALPRGALVTDVGSVKASVVRGAEAIHGDRFVGGHPMAGTEKTGPEAADPALFSGRRVILTPTERTSPEALARVTSLWRAAGADVVEMSAEAHDEVVAAVSHLPHALAYAMAGLMAGRDELKGMAGPSFRDGTRVAATPPALWLDVFLENREALVPLLDAFLDRLVALRDAIAESDGPAIERLLAEGRAARASLVP